MGAARGLPCAAAEDSGRHRGTHRSLDLQRSRRVASRRAGVYGFPCAPCRVGEGRGRRERTRGPARDKPVRSRCPQVGRRCRRSRAQCGRDPPLRQPCGGTGAGQWRQLGAAGAGLLAIGGRGERRAVPVARARGEGRSTAVGRHSGRYPRCEAGFRGRSGALSRGIEAGRGPRRVVAQTRRCRTEQGPQGGGGAGAGGGPQAQARSVAEAHAGDGVLPGSWGHGSGETAPGRRGFLCCQRRRRW